MATLILLTAAATGNLQGHWPFNGNANDESGNGLHGTVYGAALTHDRFGNENSAYEFDGKADYIDLGTSLTNKFTTVSAWVKPKGYTGKNTIVSSRETADVDEGFTLCLTGGQPRMWGKTGIWTSAISPTVPTLDNWVHVVGVRDLDNTRIYVDGVLKQEHKGGGAMDITKPGRTVIGARASGAMNHFYGAIDDVRIYDYAMTPKQVADLTARVQQCAPVTTPGHVIDTALVTGVSLSLQGMVMDSIPKTFIGMTTHVPGSLPIRTGTVTGLKCCQNHPCDFFVVAYRCQGCQSAKVNGGLPAALISSGWRPASCSPYFEHNGNRHPMVTLHKRLTAGESLDLPVTTSSLEHIAIFESVSPVTPLGAWCPGWQGPSLGVGPALAAGGAAGAAGGTAGLVQGPACAKYCITEQM